MMNGCQARLSSTNSGRSVHLSGINSSGFTKCFGSMWRCMSDTCFLENLLESSIEVIIKKRGRGGGGEGT